MRQAVLPALALATLTIATACSSGSQAGNAKPGSGSSSGASPTSSSTSSETSAPSGSGSGSPVKVGVIYSKTGLLASYGAEYYDGLQAGLDYVTKGTGKVGGHPLQVSYTDDGGDPAKATAAMKTYIGDGYKIIIGTLDSGIALQLAPLAEQNKVLYIAGAAAADKITGINKYTFRSGRQTYQDVATAGSFIGDPTGKKVTVFAQDSAFGQGNAAAVQAVLGAKGATISKLLVPLNATDFTPFARQVKQAKPDLLFVAWAGATTGPMWQALDQQGVFDVTTVVTGLGNIGSYPAYGPVASKISFLSYYFAAAPNNPVNTAMVTYLKSHGEDADLFDPDGFVAAEMVAHAVDTAGGDANVNSMISALEGWKFDAPKGQETVRAADHAMIQPMFQAKLVQQGSAWAPQLVKAVDATSVAPPSAG
jgi:branched-chain amino acid transport system substrate-binding protein